MEAQGIHECWQPPQQPLVAVTLCPHPAEDCAGTLAYERSPKLPSDTCLPYKHME
jgi:hypothetical protein